MEHAEGRLLPGARGEACASRYLEERGYTIVARNFRGRGGEIDIVARQTGQTVFVEVKERLTGGHGNGWEAVGYEKRRRLVRAALAFAARHGLLDSAVRFDVISVDWSTGAPVLRHDVNAFDARGRCSI
jgi:putative endonuclease